MTYIPSPPPRDETEAEAEENASHRHAPELLTPRQRMSMVNA